MTLHAFDHRAIPEETARVAKAAFPKGNPYMKMRDELGVLYQDNEFADLFPTTGQSAESPGELALTTVMQFAEGLSDRQAADAVRGRIDWKYALNKELSDPGFDHTVLSEFRGRLIEGGAEERLLNDMLVKFKEKGWLKSRGQQRTDSTHVLAAVRQLNRLECVGETMRQALEALAEAAPEWLLSQVTGDWFDRYGPRFESYRLPKEKKEKEALQIQIGADGWHLLTAIYEPQTPTELRTLLEVEIMRQIWIQQYYVENGQLKWREQDNLPPNSLLIQSPYDIETRNRTKRSLNWTGYTAHLTETCDEDSPNLIVNVETTPATSADIKVLNQIHTNLDDKELLPGEHLVDTAYVDGKHLHISQHDYGVDLFGPVPPNSSWQAKAGQGFDLPCFAIDWQTQTVTCPQGRVSQSWHPGQDQNGNQIIKVQFGRADCRACDCRDLCTKSETTPRGLQFKPRIEYEALQVARQRQETDQFKQTYKKRAGVEGTISQSTRSFDLRRSRYVGLAKTHLQHIAIAAAMNFSRVWTWLEQRPKAQTRRSKFLALAPST
jgi:transposase